MRRRSSARSPRYNCLFVVFVAAVASVTIISARLLLARRESPRAPATQVGLRLSWAGVWRNSHSPSAGVEGYALAVDASGCMYIGGLAGAGKGNPHRPFIVKTDAGLTELWYRDDFAPASTESEPSVDRLALAPDGSLIAHITALIDGQAYVRVMKLRPADGSVVWKTDIARGNTFASTWDTAAGPVFDRAGNIYVVTGKGVGYERYNAEPLAIYKLSRDGELLWSRDDRLASFSSQTPGWEDIWEMVADSEGSVYVSATANTRQRGLDFGLVKYSASGEHLWTRVTDMGGEWDAPRSLAIDAQDRLYQVGNGGPSGAHPSIIVYDKEGNTLRRDYLRGTNLSCLYGAVIDPAGGLVIQGVRERAPYVSEVLRYTPDLQPAGYLEYRFPDRSGGGTPARTAIDPRGRIYCLQYFLMQDDPRSAIGVMRVERG